MPLFSSLINSSLADSLRVAQGYVENSTKKQVLVIDAYFSGKTKLRWILDHVERAQEQAQRNLFGT